MSWRQRPSGTTFLWTAPFYFCNFLKSRCDRHCTGKTQFIFIHLCLDSINRLYFTCATPSYNALEHRKRVDCTDMGQNDSSGRRYRIWGSFKDVHNVPQNKDILLSSRYQPPFRPFALPREENRPGFSRRCEEHKHTYYNVGTAEQVPCLSAANTSYKLQASQSLHPCDVSLLYGWKLHTSCTRGDRQVSFGILSGFSREVPMKTLPKEHGMVLIILSLINK